MSSSNFNDTILSFWFSFLTDIDECSANTHDCHLSATCTNVDGSFTCACNAGYTGDGKLCSGAWFPLSYFFIFFIFNLFTYSFIHFCFRRIP